MPAPLQGTFHSYLPIRRLGQGAFGEVRVWWVEKHSSTVQGYPAKIHVLQVPRVCHKFRQLIH